MAGGDDDIVSRVVSAYSDAKATRGTWERHWEDAARFALPHYQTSFYTNGNTVPGAERGQDMYDVTANTALFRFGAAMESMLTPRNSTWHRIRITDPDLMKLRTVQLWCDEITRLMFHYRYAPAANFQSQQHDGYIGLGAFGTSCIFIDELRKPGQAGLRYRHINLGEVFLAENHQGVIDKVIRRFPMTLRQVAQKWGFEKVPEKFQTLAKEKPETKIWMLHMVGPRESWNPYRIDAKGMPFESCYVLEDTHTLMDESGYKQLPYAIARYITAPGEIYGRGPIMNVLPSVKVLNEEKKVVLKQGHRSVDPVLLVHDDGILDGLSLKPGATNYGAVNADGKPLVHTLPVGQVQVGKELMDDERQAINDSCLVTLFQILVEQSQMTATEVLERAREKGALLSPTMGRVQSEQFGPMIEREYGLLMRQGLLPLPPPELIEARAEFKVEYDAPLNRAMRAEQGAGIQRTMQFAAEISAQTQDPSAMDWFNYDEIIPDMADINGAPYRYINDLPSVLAKRQQRDQTQAAAQATQALPGMAAMLKAANPEGNQVAGS